MVRYISYAVATVMVLCSMFAQASTVTVQGTVMLPTCTLNGGNPIKVDFGDVLTTSIDGANYKKTPVDYTLDCEGDMTGNSLLQMSITGTDASFGDGLLVTDKTGLAVQFLSDSAPLALNTGLVKFDYSGQLPAIFAVPAKDPSATLTAGVFTATAVLHVDYQ